MGACVEPCREWVVVVDVRAPGPEGDLLLATKTTVPRLREGRVARPRLLERLRAATAREFVLVCANWDRILSVKIRGNSLASIARWMPPSRDIRM